MADGTEIPTIGIPSELKDLNGTVDSIVDGYVTDNIPPELSIDEDTGKLIRKRLDELIGEVERSRNKSNGDISTTVEQVKSCFKDAKDAVESVKLWVEVINKLTNLPLNIQLPPITHSRNHTEIETLFDKYWLSWLGCYVEKPEQLPGIQAIVNYCVDDGIDLTSLVKTVFTDKVDEDTVYKAVEEVIAWIKNLINKLTQYICKGIQALANQISDTAKAIKEFNEKYTKKIIAGIDKLIKDINNNKIFKILAGIIYRIKVMFQVYIIAITEYLVPKAIEKLVEKISGLPA
jgi:hypothetical protein